MDSYSRQLLHQLALRRAPDCGAYTPRVLRQMAKYDLTATMGKYLDKHLVLPMLDYLLECDVR